MPTYDEIQEHNRNGGCWVIIRGKVYDADKFEGHPSTLEKLKRAAKRGGDATDDFKDVGPLVQTMLDKCYVGGVGMSRIPVKKTHRPDVYHYPITPKNKAGNSASSQRGNTQNRTFLPVNLGKNATNKDSTGGTNITGFPGESSRNLPRNNGNNPVGPTYMPNTQNRTFFPVNLGMIIIWCVFFCAPLIFKQQEGRSNKSNRPGNSSTRKITGAQLLGIMVVVCVLLFFKKRKDT
ncbi:Cytochrome b5 [Handroanthus impetiginosus]|uniref:Cytochrome b5 n=1 Tax=Handroanthus impetiginosus TaxID=429701 RepID=A0A2G9IB89_9LAMI|nr:Cytochrome b5 [Handroanthus impetiginosus]